MAVMFPLRQQGPARTNGPMGPLLHEHPVVQEMIRCVSCQEPIVAGDTVTLIPVGPGADRKDREKCRAGGWYSGMSVCVHWACAAGEE